MLSLVYSIIVIQEQLKNELKRLNKRKQTEKVSKLDPLKEIINEKIELRCTAMAIFKDIDIEKKDTI